MRQKAYTAAAACIAVASFVGCANAPLSPSLEPGENATVLQTRSGVSEAVYYEIVDGAPASVILLPGGNGILAQVSGNFLLRVRDQFVQQGLSVAVPDAPSDHMYGMDVSFRASAEHAQDLDAVIAFMQAKSPGPLWIVGTSNGTISAANAAVRLGPTKVAGLVLTSSVWAGGLERVPLGLITVPTLLVHNRYDGCRSSPYSKAPNGLTQLVSAPTKELITVQSHKSRSDACGAMSPHGYLGIENQVVSPVIQWIKVHTGKMSLSKPVPRSPFALFEIAELLHSAFPAR